MVLGEKVTPAILLEDAGLHFLRKEFAKEGETRMIAFCHLFQEGQRVGWFVFPVSPVFFEKAVELGEGAFPGFGELNLRRRTAPETTFTADAVNLSVILKLSEDGLYSPGTRLERGHEHADAGQRIVTFVRGLD